MKRFEEKIRNRKLLRKGLSGFLGLVLVLCLLPVMAEEGTVESDPYALPSEEEYADGRIAEKEAVEAVAEQLFEAEWLPRGVRLNVLEEGEGLWNIHAEDEASGETVATLQIDGDNEDLVIYYRQASYTLPGLEGLEERIIPEEEQPEAWVQWAREVLGAFRGRFDADMPLICVCRLDDGCWLFAYGPVTEAECLLIARAPEEKDALPELAAYVDTNRNWEVCYDGYLSLGKAFDIACAALREKWPDLPEERLALGSSCLVLFDTAGYYQEDEEELPENLPEPLWVICVEDLRADETLECYDPSVTYRIYPVLMQPATGEIVELRTPEEPGFG